MVKQKGCGTRPRPINTERMVYSGTHSQTAHTQALTINHREAPGEGWASERHGGTTPLAVSMHINLTRSTSIISFACT